MKVAVIGTGNIGGSLARQWGAKGHEVILGVRNTSKPEVVQLVSDIGANARAVSVADAVAEAEAVLFAVPGAAMAETLAPLGPALAGKIAIDATNNRGGSGFNNVAVITGAAPEAIVYRAFNTYGWENFNDSKYSEQADLFYAGPDGDSRAKVEQLIGDAGWRPVRLGDIDQVGVVDSVVLLWFGSVGALGQGRHIALKVVS